MFILHSHLFPFHCSLSGTVCCCGVFAVAYIRYRPLLALAILAVAGAIAGIVFATLNKGAEASNQPTPAPVRAAMFYDTDIMEEELELEVY